MPTNRTRANYDELNKIAQQWTQQEQATRQMLTSLRQCMDALQGGDWVGQGANAFYAEMTSTVLPSLNRLADALGAARRTTIAIRAAVQQAEADAAAVLRDDGADYSKAGSKGRGLASLQTSSSTDGNAKNLVDSGAGNSANPGLPTMKHNKDTPVFKTPPAGARLVVGGVSVRDVKQGKLDDCFVVGSIAALAMQNPKLIENLIHDNGDGTYTVTFQEIGLFGNTAHSVTVNGDQLNYGATSASPSELWVGVLEKAYAKYKGTYQDINHGGAPQDVLMAMTGQSSPSPIAAPSVTLADLKQRLTNKEAIIASTFPEAAAIVKSDPLYKNTIVVANHAYYIEAVNESAQTITLGNPHGPGKEVTMSLADFQRVFVDVQSNPAK